MERSAETLRGVIAEVRKDFKVGERKVEAVEEEVKATEGGKADADDTEAKASEEVEKVKPEGGEAKAAEDEKVEAAE